MQRGHLAKVADITELVRAHAAGNTNAYDQAIELLYAELRRIAHRHRARMGGNPTLQTTAVVNEAYMKLKRAFGNAENSAHLLNIASRAMRQIIVDYARARRAEKRGGGAVHVELKEHDQTVENEAEQVLLIDDAINSLAAHNPRLAEVFALKFFVGLSDDELVAATGATKRTAQRDWMKARAYIGEYLSDV